jgi:group I intron endonuclease
LIGIYVIENIANRKVYIGRSKDIGSRISSHKHNLRNNIHINKYLQNAWNKYGENNFKNVIL